MKEEIKQQEEKALDLSDEFKKEIKGRKNKVGWLGLTSMIMVCFLVFGALGIGTYQIFFKPEQIDQKNSAEKIESKPVEVTENKKPEEAKQVVTPAPTTTTAPASTTEEYVVQDGDVLGSIATKFGTTVEKLKAANNIQDETLLQIGQKIKIVK
jgi:LysM repeat protein